MGCCFSSQRSQNQSPYPDTSPAAADTSARNITATSPPQSSLYTPRGSHGRRPSDPSAGSHHPSTIAPNAPLIPISPARRSHIPHGVRWTRTRLDRERNDFFDTRVTGRAEVWGVVRMVVDLVRQGQISEAQGILDASGCTCPTGEVWRGIFDEKGAFYQIPEWVVVEPTELTQEGAELGEEGKSEANGEDEDRTDGLEKEEKGKGRAIEIDPSSVIKVRARLSDRASDVVVKVGKEERVGILVRRIREGAAVPAKNKIKIGYLGRILHEHESLAAQGWREGHVVNALVFLQT